MVVAPANRHDMKRFEATLAAQGLVPPDLKDGDVRHLCLDRGYVEPGVVVYVGCDYVEGLAVGLDGCPEFGIGGRLWGGLQDGDGLVIAEDFDRGTWRDELEGVIEVFAELGEGAWVERGGVKAFSGKEDTQYRETLVLDSRLRGNDG
jgi:hypothetical protein